MRNPDDLFWYQSPHGRLDFWGLLLMQWKMVHEEYYLRVDDFSWNYAERSQVGMLAAAATRRGLITLEEYHCEKPNDKSGKGRTDLWLYDNNTEYFCEAKIVYLDLWQDKDVQEGKINETRDLSREDACKTDKNSNGDAYGLTFFRILNRYGEKSYGMERACEFIKSVMAKSPNSPWAMIGLNQKAYEAAFTANTKEYEEWKYISTGICLIIDRVHK